MSVRRSFLFFWNGSNAGIFSAERFPGEQSGEQRQSAADEVGQFDVHEEKNVREHRAEDAREAAETLGDAKIRALFVGGRIERNHPENRRTVQSRTDGQQCEDNEQAGHVRLKRQCGQADGKNNHAAENQFRFAEFFDQPADDATLKDCRDESGVGEKIADAIIVFGKAEAVAQKKREGEFITREAKCRKQENADEQSEFRLRERVRPLIYFWPRGGGFGTWFPAFAEDEPAEDEIRGAKTRGDPAGALPSKF